MPDAVTTASSLRESAAGLAAGAISRCFIAPLDVIKIRQQIAVGSTTPSMRSVAQDVLATQSLGGFWRGNLPALGLWAAYSGIQFPVYRASVAALQEQGMSSAAAFACGGAVAGVIATSATYPLDLLRTASIAASHGSDSRPSLLTLLSTQLRQHSWRGLYHGMSPAVLAVVPSNAVLFLVYEPLRAAFAGHSGIMHHIGTAVGVGSAAGAAAGVASKLVTYPLDTARKRMQVHGMRTGSSQQYALLACLRDTYNDGGIRSLYRGLLPALLKVAASMGPALAVYEATRSLLAAGK